MIDIYKQVTLGQFEATLAMLKQGVERCPGDLWESKIAELTVRQVVYHTLFFVDFYLAENESAFRMRDLHRLGGDESQPVICLGLDKRATLELLALCHEKLLMTLPTETEETLRGPSGFSRCKFTRAELHLYNLRHVQHHAGQLSGHLRRMDPECREPGDLNWVPSGWR